MSFPNKDDKEIDASVTTHEEISRSLDWDPDVGIPIESPLYAAVHFDEALFGADLSGGASEPVLLDPEEYDEELVEYLGRESDIPGWEEPVPAPLDPEDIHELDDQYEEDEELDDQEEPDEELDPEDPFAKYAEGPVDEDEDDP